ncbi:MBL fold metallo-hydrolase [Pengzhenrongella sp.]|uniref:MBL fold metallo-hydrolase n=1 Tax=Pengzhenrongella sp. TaxID=2888820 RepID=UPI002F936536
MTARELTEVAPGVWTATAVIWRSLSTVVVADDGACLVVDPGITVAEIAGLATAIRERGWSVVAGFSTHPHWDHVLWARALGDGPRWATPRGAAHAHATRPHVLAEADAAAPGHDRDLTGRLTPLPDGAGEIPWDGPRAVVVPLAGHCPGHAGLVLPAGGVLLSGDMLCDEEIPLLDVDAADPVADYRAGLDALEAAAREHRIEVLLPGHGHVGDVREMGRRLAKDRAYLDELEAGHPCTDARAETPWLAQEHALQFARLHGA